MTLMGGNSIGRYLKTQQTAWQGFQRRLGAADAKPNTQMEGRSNNVKDVGFHVVSPNLRGDI
jgi:hypothetical protein